MVLVGAGVGNGATAGALTVGTIAAAVPALLSATDTVTAGGLWIGRITGGTIAGCKRESKH